MIKESSITIRSRISKKLVIKKYPAPGQSFEIKVHGSKNCVLPIIMYTFLLGQNNEIKIKNIPPITDVRNTLKLFATMGGVFEYNEEKNELIVKGGIKSSQIPIRYLKKNRIVILLMSILLVKFGKVEFPEETGGCNLGGRPYDYHLKAFEQLGCSVIRNRKGYLIKKDYFPQKAIVNFIKETTTGTENALFLANFNCGKTIIKKAHLRPEIMELIKFMNKLGSDIEIKDDNILINNNQTAINNKEVTFTIIDDMEEALSYVALGFATDSFFKIYFNNPYRYKELEIITELSQGSLILKENLIIQKPYIAKKHRFVEITTGPYPGLSSDAQPIMAALLLVMSESFQINEKRFKGRFKYFEYFESFKIDCEHNEDFIKVNSTAIEPSDQNHDLIAYDLRTAMNSILIASLTRRKITLIGSEIILRGYTNFFDTLKDLGFELDEQ